MGMPHSVSFFATTSAVRTSWKHSSGCAWMSRRTAARPAASARMESMIFMMIDLKNYILTRPSLTCWAQGFKAVSDPALLHGVARHAGAANANHLRRFAPATRIGVRATWVEGAAAGRAQRVGHFARYRGAGEVPNPLSPPSGCAFHPRCPHANARCRSETPEMIRIGSARVACHAVQEGRI